MSTITTLLFLAVLSLSTAKDIAAKIVPGFTHIGSSFVERFGSRRDYYLSHLTANQAKAQLDCKQMFDGNLIQILTSNQNTQLRQYLETIVTTTAYVWTSGKRDSTTTAWYWSNTLIPISYSNWVSGQPSTNLCLSVRGKGLTYGWYGSSCTSTYQYICEV